MKADQIVDKATLWEWARSRPMPQEAHVAYRAALRTFPLWLGGRDADLPATDEAFDFHVMRAALCIGLAVRFPADALISALLQPFGQDFGRLRARLIGDRGDANKIISNSLPNALYRIASGFVTAGVVPHTIAFNDATRDALTHPTAGILGLGSSERYGELFEQVRLDAKLIETNDDLWVAALWTRQPPQWSINAESLGRVVSLGPDNETWDFWLRWWDGVLSGNQLDWDLQKAVALEIPEEAWSDPKTVAAHIREIEARFEREEIRQEVAELKQELAEAIARHDAQAPLHDRSHNNPPELIEPATELRSTSTLVWVALDSADRELSKKKPEASALKAVADKLAAAAKTAIFYSAKLADLYAQEAAKSLGKHTATFLYTGLTLSLFWDKLSQVGQRILDFASKLQ